MLKKTNAQFAIEFIILLAFMFLVFLGFTAVITAQILDAKESERQQVTEDIAALVKDEIELAKSVSDGYTRNFELPARISGNSYSIEIIDNRELVVNYLDKEYVLFLPEKICGDIFIPDNIVDKENGIICANSNLDINQCQNTQDLGLCDEIESELLPGSKCCCCSRYDLCC